MIRKINYIVPQLPVGAVLKSAKTKVLYSERKLFEEGNPEWKQPQCKVFDISYHNDPPDKLLPPYLKLKNIGGSKALVGKARFWIANVKVSFKVELSGKSQEYSFSFSYYHGSAALRKDEKKVDVIQYQYEASGDGVNEIGLNENTVPIYHSNDENERNNHGGYPKNSSQAWNGHVNEDEIELEIDSVVEDHYEKRKRNDGILEDIQSKRQRNTLEGTYSVAEIIEVTGEQEFDYEMLSDISDFDLSDLPNLGDLQSFDFDEIGSLDGDEPIVLDDDIGEYIEDDIVEDACNNQVIDMDKEYINCEENDSFLQNPDLLQLSVDSEDDVFNWIDI